MSKPDVYISLLTMELVIPWARSLKDKRGVVRALKERLRSRFNASVAEVAYQDKWQRATLVVCAVDNDRRQLEATMARIRRLSDNARDLEIADIRQQWL